MNPGKFDELVCEVLAWQKSDGPTKGVWSDYPRGNRCFWTANWSTSQGQINAHQLVAVSMENISDRGLLCELDDYVWRDIGDYALRAARLILLHQDKKPWRGAAESLCRTIRGSAMTKSYTSFWDPPGSDVLMFPRYRPGWPGGEEPKPVPQPEKITDPGFSYKRAGLIGPVNRQLYRQKRYDEIEPEILEKLREGDK